MQISADLRCYALFDLNPDAVYCVSPDGVVLDVNVAAERIAGRPRDDIVGRHYTSFFSPENLDAATEAFTAVAAGQAIVHQTLTVTRPNGDKVALDVSAYPMVADGKLMGVCGIARDISERVAEREELRRSEQALRESEELFRQLTENLDQVFYLSDRVANRVLYVSPQFEDLWGISTEEVISDPRAIFDRIHPEDRRRVEQGAFKETEFELEYRLLRADGSLRWVHDKGFPVRDENGNVTRVAGIVEDVTEKKLLEEQLRQAQKMESVGQLAGGIAHDFNNLLLVVLNSARFIEEELPPDHPAREDLQLIVESGERGALLIRQLLAFSRKQIVEPKVLNVNDVIDEMQALLRRTVGEKIEVLFRADPRLALTQIDPNQLSQVLMNLLVNARDAMPQGGTVSIETRNVVLSEDVDSGIDVLPAGSYVCISVSDTGYGMERDLLPKIFEPFFSTKSKAEATGLGLSMVYGIVSQAGGRVSVYSEPRIGTTFKIYLPSAHGSVSSETPARPRSQRPSRDQVILVAEDDPAVSSAVARMLTREGFTILHAQSGDAALKMCRTYPGRIDLLLSDVVMPGMSGRELGIHAHALRPEMKVLYMSGYSEDMIGRHGILQVDENYVQKPFTSADLIDKIDLVLGS